MTAPTANNNNICQKMVKNEGGSICSAASINDITNYYSIRTNSNNNNDDIYIKHQQRQPTINKFSKAATFHTNIPALNWLDTLEKNFDKAFVDLDLLLGDFDADQVNVF